MLIVKFLKDVKVKSIKSKVSRQCEGKQVKYRNAFLLQVWDLILIYLFEIMSVFGSVKLEWV